MASINLFINNFEMFDNLILNNLTNQKRALHQLIKKRAEKIRKLTVTQILECTSNSPNIHTLGYHNKQQKRKICQLSSESGDTRRNIISNEETKEV